MNILFVCRYNRFRSRIAKDYFNKINKNKNIRSKSAGLIKGSPLSPRTIKVAKEFGLDINGRVNGLSSKLMAWQNIVVIVADDVPKAVFDKNKKYYKKKVINWKIKDAKYETKTEIKKLVKQIMKKADYLNKQLENKKWK